MISKFVGIVSFVVTVVLFVGCSNPSEPTAPTSLEDGVSSSTRPTMITIPQPLPEQQPMLDHRQPATAHSIIVVKPNPNIDYKIVTVTPDPNIDYKIVVVNPKSAVELPKSTEDIAKGQN